MSTAHPWGQKTLLKMSVPRSIRKYVEVELDVDLELTAEDLAKIGMDDLRDVVRAKGFDMPDSQNEIDAAYLALRADTPEPIRKLVLACAGRIA